MALQTAATLKRKTSRQYHNVIDSNLNLTDGGTVTGILHPDGGQKCNITVLGDGISTRQLTAADCGIVTIGVVGTETAAAKGFNIDLPTPAAGLWYKIIFVGPSIANNSNAAITVTSNSDDSSTAANLIVGSFLGSGDDQGANVTSVADLITFVHAKATAGDFVELWCDGTNWIAEGRYDVDAALTLA